MLKSKVVMTYFMFVLLRPRRNDREQFQRKEGLFIDFHEILNWEPLESAWLADPTRRLVPIFRAGIMVWDMGHTNIIEFLSLN